MDAVLQLLLSYSRLLLPVMLVLTVAVLDNQVEEVKSVMMKNIEQVLERGEKLDQLMAQSEELNVQAEKFKVKENSFHLVSVWEIVYTCTSSVFNEFYYIG